MPNLVNVEYHQTGNSKSTNHFGMREMQERAFDHRDAKYMLLKSPPASGKSRALMFLALDKLINQGIKKVIVAVPERSIGSSFAATDLKKFGFFANWSPKEKYNLCTAGSDGSKSKVNSFHNFMEETNKEQILICTHATLRFACEGLDEKIFDNVLLAIDEFHHVSIAGDSKLGEILKNIMDKSKAHIVAMTGSYFRGDSIPILLPEDEAKFTKVTYNYYEQLNGYNYLKTLGIGYHFYQGKYTNAIMEVLDTNKKTILHIPSVNSGESTKDKRNEVDFIIDAIGDVERQDSETGVLYVKRKTDGKILKIADLVEDTQKERDKIQNYLRNITSVDDIDIIIALGMAKEGFDWPYCEHALTVGYRGSLTEIIQIIGRATRDSDNKTHAQFTNLIAQPNAADDEVKFSVNNMLKAITASLLMEQVLAPNWKFKAKVLEDDKAKAGEIKIKGLKEPSSQRVKDIVEEDLTDLKAAIFQDSTMLKAMPDTSVDAEVINKILIPKVIRIKYPDLDEAQVEEVRQHVVVDSVVKNGEIKEVGDKRFIRMAGSFVDIDEMHIDLIDRVNPFQEAFEVLSKSVSAKVLKIIQETIQSTRIQMDFEEAALLWPKIQEFIKTHKREPNINSVMPQEKRLAECIIYLKEQKRKKAAENEG
ncbi:MAG: ATP-dependent helicase [Flexibacter sp. CG_4_10_14_3_um_filter_32_15]|nr:MAG: ATP-dependent helicase [Flexibacter sp. CG_4_10_14_3_um_filter_32_15]